MPDLVLFQPDIPGNAGTLLRLGACTGTTVHIIEPAGFRMDEKAFRRAGMDYLDQAALKRHLSWTEFENWRKAQHRRLILLTTRAEQSYTQFTYENNDLLMLGRESSGAPEEVHEAADHRVIINMKAETRSLNMALSGAMVLGEALRQVEDQTKN
jgi:tRNA (cytidine/uridine-2'-O-)-methyltransferase